MEETVELIDLVGEHLLDAVEWTHDGDANGFSFRLDGKVYTAIENEADDYRSYLGSVSVGRSIGNTFAPVKVLARLADEDSRETLQVIDVISGKMILEVGTNRYDDYYPCFVCTYSPENMAVNQTS